MKIRDCRVPGVGNACHQGETPGECRKRHRRVLMQLAWTKGHERTFARDIARTGLKHRTQGSDFACKGGSVRAGLDGCESVMLFVVKEPVEPQV